MAENQVNIPLLRKCLEWAEAEAAKPPELCEWEQNWYSLTVEDRERLQRLYDDPKQFPGQFSAVHKAPECGTCFCIAGYVTAMSGGDIEDADGEGRRLLGLTPSQSDALFSGGNPIADVRRIAEDIAGERL